MAVETAVPTRYEQRINLVSETLRKHTKLGAGDAAAAAVSVLEALDKIPETMR